MGIRDVTSPQDAGIQSLAIHGHAAVAVSRYSVVIVCGGDMKVISWDPINERLEVAQ